MTQPEALWLADWLDAEACGGSNWNAKMNAAAAELRRLHDLAIERQGKIYALEMARSMEQKTAKLQRDALLEALHDMLNAENDYPYGGMSQSEIAAINKARAAIKAVEEGK
jgi:hypothetical protein